MGLHLAAVVSRFLDRWRFVVLLTIVAALAWTASAAALAKPFWHDEIYTLLLAQLPSVSTIWVAEREGVDLVPPLNTLATRATIHTFPMSPVAMRLPALVGFCAMTVFVFALVRARANATLAVVAALIPVQTAAYRYSYEARPYGLWMGLFALTLFAWTEAARARRRAFHLSLLAFGLAASVWTHYYAAATIGVIEIGEVVRQAVQRKVDWRMWAAFGIAGLASLPLVTLLPAATEQSRQFWTHANDTTLRDAYWFLVQPLVLLFWNAWGAIIGAVLLVSSAFETRRRRSRATTGHADPPSSPAWHLPIHETVTFMLAAALPAVMLFTSDVSSAPFTYRYALPGVVGIAVAMPLAVRFATPRGSVAELLICGMLLVPLGNALVVASSRRPAAPNPLEQRPILAGALTSGIVAASGSLTFLQLWYYATPAQRERFVYLADPALALRFTGSDTFDRGYLKLAKWAPVPVERYDKFLERSGSFNMYAAGSGWLLDKLNEDGATVELIAAEPGGRLFRVTPGAGSTTR
jgi:hypothetical protein